MRVAVGISVLRGVGVNNGIGLIGTGYGVGCGAIGSQAMRANNNTNNSAKDGRLNLFIEKLSPINNKKIATLPCISLNEII